MLNPGQFREIVSGRRRGPAAAILRALLRVAEVPYTAAVTWRNRRYDTARAEVHRAGVPVVSVGNLTVGGTGKTPMVEWLARWFRQRGVRVVIISRGYGAEAGASNDEALELEQKLPDVPHLQNPDRVAAARVAVEELECELILLDDAMQHRRIGRDLEIVLLDALEPFGFGHVFPRGTLREPLAGLCRADVIALSRADMLDETQRAAVWSRVRQYNATAHTMELSHAACALRNAEGEEQPLDVLTDRPITAFCGIGNPAGFRHTLKSCGYQMAAFREFPDHHRYDRSDVESLARWVEDEDARLHAATPSSNLAAVVCTHKDLVKLGVNRLGKTPLWAVRIGLDILAGQDGLQQRLGQLL